MEQLEDATWDCGECSFLRSVVVWAQMPKTPLQKGIWMGKIWRHEEASGHLVYPKDMLPWRGETLVMPEGSMPEQSVPVAQRTRASAS